MFIFVLIYFYKKLIKKFLKIKITLYFKFHMFKATEQDLKTELNTVYWVSKNMIIEYISNENKICKYQTTIMMSSHHIFLKNCYYYNKEDDNEIKRQKFNQYIKEKINENKNNEVIYLNNEWKTNIYKNVHGKQIKKIKKNINAKTIIKIYKNMSYNLIIVIDYSY